MWQIKFLDVDPDTGKTSQEKTIAHTTEEQHAMSIIDAMSRTDEEPNRTYFATKENTEHAK